MKLFRFLVIVVCAATAISISRCSLAAGPAATSTEGADAVSPYLGRWDITLKAPDREYPSWLELQSEGGQLHAQMVGRWGNARPLPKVEFTNGRIVFISPKEEESSTSDLRFEGQLHGDTLSGTLNGPDGKIWQWSGVRAPAMKRTSAPVWGDPIKLFNGKDLSGWKMGAPGTPAWTVQDGVLITPGNGPELYSDATFQDFKLHVEFNCGKDSNSGVYLRGRYETQIETESQAEPPSHHTGGIYGFIAPTPEQPRTPDVWQTFDITLIGRTVTVVLNGKTVIDKKEIPGITGGAVDSNEAKPGPIYLQGSEKGHVSFRSIVITPAK